MKSAIVVTGAAGFIGSCIVKELNLRGEEELILIDRLGSGSKWKNLVGKNYREFVHKERSLDWLKEHADRIRTLIHMGACSSTRERDADYLLENNTCYSQQLALLARERGWRFLYASSAATYGDGSLGFEANLDQLKQLRPLNIYGYSKHLFDCWLFRERLFEEFVGLKFFNVFGPNEWHKKSMASPFLKMIEQARKGSIELFRSYDPLYADGEQSRDFIYVKDVARIVCDLVEKPSRGLYNLGRGQSVSWNRVAEITLEALGLERAICYVDMPNDLAGQYQNRTCASMEGWEATGVEGAKWDLPEAIKDYVQNHLLSHTYW